MVDILASINHLIAKLFYLAVSIGVGILVVLLAPVLAIALPIYFLHSGDQENIQLLMTAFILIGPIAAAFWFSVMAKSREERKENNGIGGAIVRMFIGFILSCGCEAIAGQHLYWLRYHYGPDLNFHGMNWDVALILKTLTMLGISSPVDAVWFVEMVLALATPTFLVVLFKLYKAAQGPKCVCNGSKCFNSNCGGTIRRGFCTDCNMDNTVVA